MSLQSNWLYHSFPTCKCGTGLAFAVFAAQPLVLLFLMSGRPPKGTSLHAQTSWGEGIDFTRVPGARDTDPHHQHPSACVPHCSRSLHCICVEWLVQTKSKHFEGTKHWWESGRGWKHSFPLDRSMVHKGSAYSTWYLWVLSIFHCEIGASLWERGLGPPTPPSCWRQAPLHPSPCAGLRASQPGCRERSINVQTSSRHFL